MTAAINRFYNSIKEAAGASDRELVSFFGYYLTVEAGQEAFTAKAINQCFNDVNLSPPSRTAQYLSEGAAKAKKLFVKHAEGYQLQRHHRDELAGRFGGELPRVQAHPALRKLEGRVSGAEQAFLKETIDCFEVGANRATIVMCWILTLDHMCDYIFGKKLPEFNAVLATNTDKRVKINQVKSRDDFSDIPERKLIEFMRSASIISNDVRKILDEKLGIRNSSAHASSISIKPTKVVEFVDDLIENVVLKYN
jgi:uncharacterized protein YbcI